MVIKNNPLFLLALMALSGNTFAASISGTVWDDVNTNGVIDGGESGINISGGITLVANEVGTAVCATTTTNALGQYTFTTVSGNRTFRIYEANTWVAGDACPPTENVLNGGIPPNHITQGTIQDPATYTSSTANVLEISYTGNATVTGQDFGDYVRTPFGVCEGAGLLIQGSPADLIGVNLDTGASLSLQVNLAGVRINATGYNVLDDFVYGWDQTNNNRLMRIGLNGATYIGDALIPTLSRATESFIVGDVSTDGYYYATDGDINADPGTTQVYKIDVSYQRLTFRQQVQAFNAIDTTALGSDSVQDWAYNPVDDLLYSVSRTNGHLIQTDLANNVVNDLGVIFADGLSVKDASLGTTTAFGAVYFDRAGFFYFSNNTTGFIYRMDLSNVPTSIPTDSGGNLLVTNYSLGPASAQNDGARCLLADGPAQDYGDAPIQGSDANGAFAFGSAHHNVKDTADTLKIGTVTTDSESDAFYDSFNAAANDTDEQTGTNDESGEGVKLSRQPLTAGNTFTIDVTVTNTTGSDAFLTGYLDWRAAGGTANAFDTYNSSTFLYTVDSDDISNTQTIPSGGSAVVTLTWTIPAGFAVVGDFTSYLRLRLSSNQAQTQVARGGAADGEVEDYQIIIGPTAVTIGKVELKASAVTDLLAELGVPTMENAALWSLLSTWDSNADPALANADRTALLQALNAYLDPDADGQVAVFSWDTLEERGTIGFYAQRSEGGGKWISLNDQMLPALITAPMGGEYQLADPSASSGKQYQYRLIEQEARGNRNTYGPYKLQMQ